MRFNERVHARVAWARPYAKRVRFARVVALGSGLALSLVVAHVHLWHLHETSFLTGAALFLVATGLTWTRNFERLQPWVLTIVPVLDIAVIGLFDLVHDAEVVDALVVLPAMWLGVTLGRRGVVLVVLAAGAVVPGLPTHGVPSEGWPGAVSFVLLAALSSAGITVANEVWISQTRALKRANRAKGDFIALVSHELRTPLTSIIGYLDMVDDVEDPIPEEALFYLAAVNRNSDRLLLLVTDLLEACDLENAPMRLTMKPTDVSAVVNLSLDDLAQRATQAGLTVVRDVCSNVAITADASRLHQVVDNLVSNAIKFTPAGGLISVSLLRQGDGIDLVVRDAGVGIDRESLQHLGTKFFRAPRTTRDAIPGVGLGLMVAKTIVEAHNGTMTFTSRENVGTLICVHLPSENGSIQQPPAPGPDLIAAEIALAHRG